MSNFEDLEHPVVVRPRSAGLALVYVKLFDNCNLQCNMCDCWTLKPQRLPRDQAKQVVASVLTAQPRAVRFTGGEPLLYPALDDLVRMVADAGARPLVISNGRVLDRRVAALADAGLAELVVSIDGPVEIHDRIRGLESISGIRVGLANLPGHVVLGVNTVVQALNVQHLDETLDLLMNLPVRPQWWHLIPVRGDHQPDPAKARPAIAQVIASARSAGIDVIADPTMFEASVAECIVPRFVLFVDALTGDTFGCNMLAYADRPVGNVLERPLADIDAGYDLDELRQRCSAAAHLPCRRCDPSSRSMNLAFRQRFE